MFNFPYILHLCVYDCIYVCMYDVYIYMIVYMYVKGCKEQEKQGPFPQGLNYEMRHDFKDSDAK